MEQSTIDEIILKLTEVIGLLKSNGNSNNSVNSVNSANFNQVKAMLYSPDWPEATDPTLICDITSENDKIERGRGIVELLIDKNLTDLKFLDYGCGEGYSVIHAQASKAAKAVGYDIAAYDWSKFGEKENLVFTTDFSTVVSNGPYDAILMFDVLDHLKNEKPVEALKKIYSLLKDDGLLYCYVHPFTSKHATHLYHTLNKAYLHLVFTPDELKQLVPNDPFMEHNLGVSTPLKTYGEYFNLAGLDGGNIGRQDSVEPVSNFFKQPIIASRIMKNLGIGVFPEFQMSLQWISYVMRKRR